jgi:hypothetical protein
VSRLSSKVMSPAAVLREGPLEAFKIRLKMVVGSCYFNLFRGPLVSVLFFVVCFG